MAQIIENRDREPAIVKFAKISLYLQNQYNILSTIMKVGENFIQHTCFRSERGQEKSACRVSFVLVLHVKIAVRPRSNKLNISLNNTEHLLSAECSERLTTLLSLVHPC